MLDSYINVPPDDRTVGCVPPSWGTRPDWTGNRMFAVCVDGGALAIAPRGAGHWSQIASTNRLERVTGELATPEASAKDSASSLRRDLFAKVRIPIWQLL